MDDGIRITLSVATLSRRVKGTCRSQAQSNAEKRLLTEAEEKVLIQYAQKLSHEGWPLSRRRLEEHANKILQGRIAGFNSVGVSWAARFVERHKDQLKGMRSHALDTQRAQASNPVFKAEYFRLLKEVLEGGGGDDQILEENIYGVDETGVQSGIGTAEYVYGDAKKTLQQQQRGGGRENITVIETICADGTADFPPVVIFKSKAFHSSWVQENPLKAM